MDGFTYSKPQTSPNSGDPRNFNLPANWLALAQPTTRPGWVWVPLHTNDLYRRLNMGYHINLSYIEQAPAPKAPLLAAERQAWLNMQSNIERKLAVIESSDYTRYEQEQVSSELLKLQALGFLEPQHIKRLSRVIAPKH